MHPIKFVGIVGLCCLSIVLVVGAIFDLNPLNPPRSDTSSQPTSVAVPPPVGPALTAAARPAPVPATAARPANPPALATLEQRYQKANNNAAYPQLDARLAQIYRRRPTQQLSIEQVVAALETESVWQPTAREHAAPEFTHVQAEQLNDGRAFIEYNPYKFEAALRGDEIPLTFPELQTTLTARIDNIERTDTVVRWSGTFTEYPPGALNSFSLSQTLVDRYTVANFTTPSGAFSLEAKNGVGWINSQARGFVLPEDGIDYVIIDEAEK